MPLVVLGSGLFDGESLLGVTGAGHDVAGGKRLIFAVDIAALVLNRHRIERVICKNLCVIGLSRGTVCKERRWRGEGAIVAVGRQVVEIEALIARVHVDIAVALSKDVPLALTRDVLRSHVVVDG